MDEDDKATNLDFIRVKRVLPCVWPNPSASTCKAYQGTASECRGCCLNGVREVSGDE